MIKINKALVLLGMLLLAAVASAQEAENIQQAAEAQPTMGMPNLNARRLNTVPFKGAFYGGYGYGYPFYNYGYNYGFPYYGYPYGRFFG